MPAGDKMPNCKLCQKSVPADAEQCPHCGAWLDRPAGRPKRESKGDSLEDQVRALLAEGKKIDAVRLYQQQTGAGLAEAKTAVERIERGENPTEAAAAADAVEQQVLDLLKAGKKIDAIKVYRQLAHADLKTAKDAVEALAARHGVLQSSGSGCFGVLAMLLSAMVLLVIGWLRMNG